MDLRDRAEAVVRDACAAVGGNLDDAKTRLVSDIIEQAPIDVMRESAKHHSHAAQEVCPADRDLAHKIAEEIRLKNVGLIANLKGLRA